jgi:hypothetical protein
MNFISPISSAESISLSGWEITQHAPILSFAQHPVARAVFPKANFLASRWADPFESGCAKRSKEKNGKSFTKPVENRNPPAK